MINIVISVKSFEKKIFPIIAEIEKTNFEEELQVFFLCERTNPIINEFENLSKQKFKTNLLTYPLGTSEETMLEHCIKEKVEGKLIVIRNDCTNINVNVIQMLALHLKQGADIALPKNKQKQNRIANAFRRVLSKLVIKIMNFNFYDGDITIEAFGENAVNIMKTTNSVVLTKFNRWIGMKIDYVEFDLEKTKIKTTQNKKPIFLMIFYAILTILTLGLAIYVLSSYDLGHFINTIYIILVIFYFMMFLVWSLRLYIFLRVGSLTLEQAKLVSETNK